MSDLLFRKERPRAICSGRSLQKIGGSDSLFFTSKSLFRSQKTSESLEKPMSEFIILESIQSSTGTEYSWVFGRQKTPQNSSSPPPPNPLNWGIVRNSRSYRSISGVSVSFLLSLSLSLRWFLYHEEPYTQGRLILPSTFVIIVVISLVCWGEGRGGGIKKPHRF